MNRAFLRSVALKRNRVTSFADYPFAIPAVRSLTSLDFDPAVTFFIGENGSGKSTLLEAIAVALGFNAEGGSRNFTFATRASHSSLSEYLRLTRGVSRPQSGFFLRAESFYTLATEIEALEEARKLERRDGINVTTGPGERSLHELSHGEALLALLLHRFTRSGLYLMDEPESALSPARQLACLRRMHDLVRAGSQFVIATHSPILMAYPGAKIYQFSDAGIALVPYEDTEHYQVTRAFLERRHAMLEELFRSDQNDPG